MDISYSFFASSHGKGAVDGVGGTVKRQVRSHILAKKELISSADQYAEVASRVCPGVNIVHLPKKDIEDTLENGYRYVQW